MVDRFPLYQPNGHSSLSPRFIQQATLRCHQPPNFLRNTIDHHGFHVPNGQYTSQSMTSFPEAQRAAGQDGPPFGETSVLHPVFNMRQQQLMPEITASIQKGFFQVDRKWTCYRRNYFAVSCHFAFKTHVVEGPFYLNRNGQPEPVYQFAVSISAKTALTSNGESESRGLIQHTPKRDKATETVPGRHQIAPTPHQAIGSSGVFPRAAPIYGGSQHVSSGVIGSYGGYENPGAASIPTTHTFERIQFQKATANNGKRRAQQQYFLVVVELSANISRSGSEDGWIIIATKESDPMVVRGRSPGHYKDNGRRDSQTMDPDRGTGPGGDGPPGSLSSAGYGHPAMDWMQTHRSSNVYSGSTYRQAVIVEYSPTLNGTPTEAEINLSDSHTAKSSCTLSSDRSALTPLSEGSDEILFNLDHHTVSRKRAYDEDDGGEEHLRFHPPGPFGDGVPSFAAFSAMPCSKLLCASS